MFSNSRLLTSTFASVNYWLTKPSSLIFSGLICIGLNINPVQAENNILVIHSYDSQLSRTKKQLAEIERGFTEINRESNVFHEFLNSKRNRSSKHQEFINYINKKYAQIPINLMMTVDEPSLQLVMKQRDRLDMNPPVVFLGIQNIRQELLDTPWLTGVIENYSLVETAIEATRQMWTNTIIVINDSTEAGKENLEQIEKIKQLSNQPLNIELINDLAIDDINTRLNKYPDRIPILLLGQLLQNNLERTIIDPSEDTKILQNRIPNPIYVEDEMRLSKNVVGGKIFDRQYHIKQAVELANEILAGTRPDEVGPITFSKNRWIFNYPQLLHYNIQLDLLPKDSELLYVEPPFYIKNKTFVLVIALCLLCSCLIIALLVQKIRRKAIASKILQENEQRYRDLARAGANVFWELDERLKYSYISGDIRDLCGLRPSEILGYYPPDLHKDSPNLDVDWELFELITKTRRPLKNFTFSLRDKEDKVRIFKINGNPLYDRNYQFKGYRGVKQEITAEQNLYQKIAYQATYDDLTGLLNRREFNEKLKNSVQKAQKYATESVLCYLDLDRFKIVNDTAGHLVGDRLLSELAQLLQSMIRKEDTLGRLGGDEFGLLLEGCSLEEAEQVCEQLIHAINNYRLKWKNVEFDVGVSIGMVGISQNVADANELLSRADLACYQAKNMGRGRVYVAENNHQELDLQQTQMGHIANVSQAIEEDRFYLVKQLIKPMVERDNQQQHYELLLRLKDRSGKVITPEEFIPIAERYGVITIVDRWVLKTALDLYTVHFAEQRSIVSINLSGTSINDERFTNFALDLIKKSRVPGDCLCFEITETAAISQINHAQKFITTMKDLGVKFALDDFGSGVSSFGYLKNLSVDYLKIDGSLIKAILNEDYDRAIVNSINEIAHLMGIKTIAELVENERILERLNEINIDYAQGYVTGKPMAIVS